MLWKTKLAIILLFGAGCAPGAYNAGSLDSQVRTNYCHRKIEPIGPTDPGKPGQVGAGDYIDYYGPCDGPTRREQIADQRRFEQFRFGRDYIDD